MVEMLPACSRASSCWFSWLAVLPVGCALAPWWCTPILCACACVVCACPCTWVCVYRRPGGVAEVFSVAGADGAAEGGVVGWLAGCAQTGLEMASAATTAAPVRSCRIVKSSE